MSSNDTSADRDLVEKEVIFAQLIALQTLCSTEVSGSVSPVDFRDLLSGVQFSLSVPNARETGGSSPLPQLDGFQGSSRHLPSP